MKARIFISITVFISILLLLFARESLYAKYWPTKKWKTSIPEKQGMDPELIGQISSYVQEKYPFGGKIMKYI